MTPATELGPTAGLVDTVAAAAQRSGEAYLLLDQFEEYFLYHGADGPLAEALPELLRRPGLRVNVLLALRDDALAELDAFAGRLPRRSETWCGWNGSTAAAARDATVVGPLERYGELAGETFHAEPELIDALLDEVAAGRVDFAASRAGSSETRSRRRISSSFSSGCGPRSARPARRSYASRRCGVSVGRTQSCATTSTGRSNGLPAAEQDRSWRGSSGSSSRRPGAKVSHTAADLAAYTAVDAVELRLVLERLARERIVRVLEGARRQSRRATRSSTTCSRSRSSPGGPDMRSARARARGAAPAAAALVAASLAALVVVGAVAVFALAQRGGRRSQARRAHARELGAGARRSRPIRRRASRSRCTRRSSAPGTQAEDVLALERAGDARAPRPAARRQRRRRGFSPTGELLARREQQRLARLLRRTGSRPREASRARQRLTRPAWSPDANLFADGDASGTVTVWSARDGRALRRVEHTRRLGAPFTRDELLAASGGRFGS